jgi:hypothetical protein
MTTTPVYQQLLAEIDDDLERKTLDVLLEQYGSQQKSSRVYLVWRVLGVADQTPNSVSDRKVRKVIEHLRAKGWPIVSSSGEAGYSLEDDETKIRMFAAEQESRAERSRDTARTAYGWLAKARAIREYKRTQVTATQERLI